MACRWEGGVGGGGGLMALEDLLSIDSCGGRTTGAGLGRDPAAWSNQNQSAKVRSKLTSPQLPSPCGIVLVW